MVKTNAFMAIGSLHNLIPSSFVSSWIIYFSAILFLNFCVLITVFYSSHITCRSSSGSSSVGAYYYRDCLFIYQPYTCGSTVVWFKFCYLFLICLSTCMPYIILLLVFIILCRIGCCLFLYCLSILSAGVQVL